jgi:hypothetical protein
MVLHFRTVVHKKEALFNSLYTSITCTIINVCGYIFTFSKA